MALGDFYKGIEDKYYNFVDWLDGKGLNFYPVIDKIEEHNIPSFPIAVLALVLIIAGIAIGISMLVIPQTGITFAVLDEDGIAVEGAQILVTTNSGIELGGVTGVDGRVTIVIPAGSAEAEISKEGYANEIVSLEVLGMTEEEVLLKSETTVLSKTIQLMKSGTSQLLDEDISVRFTCSDPEASGFDEIKVSSGGTIALDVPGNCGSLIATPLTGYSAPNGVISLQETAPQLFLQAVESNTGTVNVFVETEEGEALAGITVIVYSQDGIQKGTSYTSAAGTAVFESIPTGSYYVIVHDSQGHYAGYDSSTEGVLGIKELVKDGSVSFNAELSEATVGTIKAIVKDSSTSLPIENAAVYLKKNNATVDTAYTDSEGVVEFNVGENVEYCLEVDSGVYLIAIVNNVRASQSFNEIYLEAATAGNTQVLKVEVVDNRQKPIDGVRLVLKKADGTIYANNVVTGADGVGEFTNLPLETYYVYVVKKGFEGRDSDPITLRSRQENKITVVLPIGFGNLEVLVLNDELQPVQGAVIEAINVVDEEKEQEAITDLDGKAIFNFRADKKVFFKVDAEEFLPYYSIAVMPDADSTVTTEILLAKDPGQVEVKLVGMYLDGEVAPKELAPGQKYTARLLLLLPKNSYFDEAGLHLRVGNANEGKTNIMEEDSVYIRNVIASTAGILRGTSFTPPSGYAIDSTHLTTGDSKWASLGWSNAGQGAYAVEAEIQVKDSAQLGQLLYINYRGFGKKDTYTRFPADSALGGAESTASKQALYANTEQEVYTAGPSSLCGTSFCKTFGVEDIVRNLKVDVIDQYNGTIGTVYRLHFTITSIAEQAFTNSTIEFGSQGDGLRFEDYAITDATGKRSEGSVEGYLLSKEIGTMSKGSSVFGFVDFRTEKEGSNPFTIVIKSNSQPVLSEGIDISVEAAEQLQLDVLPKEIIPMIDNQILVRVSDESDEPVSNAIVTATIDDAIVVSTESNGLGVIEFKLEMPVSGSVLVITAEKTGYKGAELEEKIDSSILTVTPPEINEKLDVLLTEVEKQIWFNNQTVTDLVISKLTFSSDFEGLVSFEWDEDYIGEGINADTDMNVFLLIGLTEQGTLVETPVKLEGSLSIYLLSAELQETFVENLPIEIRIGLGGEADSDDCIEIVPVKWDITTSADGAITEEFSIKNNCTVENQEIALSKLEAKVINGSSDSLGQFKISSDDLEISSIVIGEEYTSLADLLPVGFEGELQIEFVPTSTIESGTAKPKIEFKAVHPIVEGEEKISVKLPVEISVSNLEKCIEVIADEPIEVETTPMNTGFGQYGNYGGSYNPGYQGGYGGYGGYSSIPGVGGGYSNSGYGGMTGGYGGSSYGRSSGYYGGSAYPYSNFSSPYYTNYYDTDHDNSWKYGLGENSFIVKNNCSEAVEIDIDVPAQIRVDEENFEILPNSDTRVRVESGYRMGKYEVDIMAKRKGSLDKALKIESLDVIVRRAGEMDEECLQLSTNKIKLNNFIGKPVKTEIYNYCYDVGVRLPSGGNIIDFTCKVAGQPQNTYRFEGKEETTAYFQYQQYGYNDPFAQPSSYINQPPGNYGGETFLPTGPYGPSYGNAISSSQGYNYPYGSSPYGSNNWAQNQVGGYTGRCELIDSVYVTDEHTSGMDDGKTIQTVEFEIKPALNYRKMLCEFQGQMPFQSIFGLRVMLSQAYYRVYVDASANVKYYNPFGSATNKYFHVTLEDMWGIGDTLDECMRNAGIAGISAQRLQKCREAGSTAPIISVVNTAGLDFSRKGYQKGFVPQGLFNANDVYEYTADPDVLNIPPASGKASIVEIIPREIVHESGVRISFETVKTECPAPYPGGNWTIKMNIDRSGMDESIGCAIINNQIAIKVSRPMFWESPKETILPVRVNVLNRNESIDSVDPTTCSTPGSITPTSVRCAAGGVSGKGTNEKYGFDRLPFDWIWNGIDIQQCDEKTNGGKESFCDGVQFSIELNKKAEKVKEFVTENKAIIDDYAEFTGVAKESKNLYRLVKKQIKVKSQPIGVADDKAVETIFYLKADNEILETENKKSITDKLKNLKSMTKDVTENNMYSIATQTVKTLNAISSEDRKRTVAVVSKSFAEDSENEDVAEFVGVSKPATGEGAVFDKYVFTLDEYKAFNEKLVDALGTQGKCSKYNEDGVLEEIDVTDDDDKKLAVMCEITGGEQSGGGAKEEFVSNIFLQNLSNAIKAGGFIVGAVSEEGNENDGVKYIVSNAKDASGLKKVGGNSDFKAFYNKDVDFVSFLIKDGYNSSLRTDFTAFYTNESFGETSVSKATLEETKYGTGNWKFGNIGQESKESYSLGTSGQYRILLGLNFADEDNLEWNIGFEREKVLKEIKPEFENNYMLSMPFDGEIGLAAGSGRDGYGVLLTGNKSILLEYDNDNTAKKATEITKPATENTGSAFEQYSLQTSNALSVTNTGVVFKVIGSTITSNPSKPARVNLELNKRSGAGNEGLVYNLVEGGFGTGLIGDLNPWFVWQEGEKTFSDQVLSRPISQTLCREIGTAGYHGFVQEIGTKTNFKGLVILPFEKEYVLQLICNQGSIGSATALNTISANAGWRAGTSNQLTLNTNTDTYSSSLEYFVESIDNGKMCFTPGQNGITLNWNKEYLLSNVGTNQ